MRFKMNRLAANRVGKGGRPPTAVHTLEKALVEKPPVDRPRQPHQRMTNAGRNRSRCRSSRGFATRVPPR